MMRHGRGTCEIGVATCSDRNMQRAHRATCTYTQSSYSYAYKKQNTFDNKEGNTAYRFTFALTVLLHA